MFRTPAVALLAALVTGSQVGAQTMGSTGFSPLQTYIGQRVAEFEQIPADRRADLERLADYVRECGDAGRPIRLTFICTHNSRRSHMAQVWAATAAHHFGIEGVETFSGGTEATAFNPRAVRALRAAGLQIEQTNQAENPIYHVRFAADAAPLTAFSKVYDQAPNPREAYCAVMTCGSADRACPNVAGARRRVAITYDDPKASDGTADEGRVYAARCAQIGREMLYVFARVSKGKN